MEPTNVTPASQLLNASNAITDLHKELTVNNGIVPASWLPYLNAFKFLCEGVELFAGPELKAIITVILAAIAAAEGL
jgi:hypothetical protein